MLKETTGNQQLKGNDRYEGFCVDLLKSIAKNVGFDYEIKVVPDELYGAYDAKTGEWNGIIKELIEKVCLVFIDQVKGRRIDNCFIFILPEISLF